MKGVYMDDIRNYIKNNFKDNDIDDIKESIIESIKSKDEVLLPGLGVFFELVWNNSDEEESYYPKGFFLMSF